VTSSLAARRRLINISLEVSKKWVTTLTDLGACSTIFGTLLPVGSFRSRLRPLDFTHWVGRHAGTARIWIFCLVMTIVDVVRESLYTHLCVQTLGRTFGRVSPARYARWKMEPVADLATQLTQLADRAAYLDAASELLLKMFPADSVARITVNPEAGTADARAFFSGNRPAGVPEGWHDLWGDHPILLSCLKDASAGIWPRPLRLSDLVSDRELYATRAYQTGLRALGCNRQLSFPTSHGQANVQAWSLNRSQQDFTDAEVELSAHVQTILRLLDIAYDDHGQGAAEKDSAAGYSLTAREHEVMHLVGQGLTATAIGHLLGISPRTIGKHLEHAYTKFGCNNRVDALRRFTGR